MRDRRLSWVLVLLACGGKAGDRTRLGVEHTGPSSQGAGPEVPADDAITPDVPGAGSSENFPTASDALESSLRTSVLAQGVLDLLEAHCGTCHASGMAAGGLGDVRDIQNLIEQGFIVPGSSVTSPLLASIRDGSMPPDGVRQRLTAGEIALIARFIDELELAPAPTCEQLPFSSLDETYAAMAADILLQPEADRPFIRYLGFTYATGRRLCGPELERQRHALFKQINSVSLAPAISVPRSIDDRELVYRIDLRNYAWDRAMDLEDDGVVDFSDGWLAIVASAGPYATELEGPAADLLKRETTAAVPFLPGNVFVYATATGDLYYTLIGARRNAFDTQAELGVDLFAGQVRRAGFQIHDGDSWRELRVMRAEQGARPGRYLWVLEEQGDRHGGALFEDPLGSDRAGSQTIFQLPNGLQAYSVEDAGGARRGDASDCLYSPECFGPEFTVPAACHGCHEAGLLPVTDVVRDFVLANSVYYARHTLEEVQEVYPTASELEELLRSDSEIHLSAMQRAGVPRTAPEPISRVFMEFELDSLDLSRTAAELGVSAEALRANLERLHPALRGLSAPDGYIDRATLIPFMQGALCTLHAASENRPRDCPRLRGR